MRLPLLKKNILHAVRGAILLLLVFIQAPGQDVNPGVDKIFRPDEITSIFMTMNPADKAFLQDPANALSETYFPATFQLRNSQMDTVLSIAVGVRLRGNTSRYAEKKSFKIDFREYGGGRFFGYKKFNLKANVNDPSLVREALTLQQYRELGVYAARTHHVKLYINDEYMGVYLNVEQVDDVFLTMRLGHSSGHMYKCNWSANLSAASQAMDPVLFESEINKSTDTRTEISQFIQTLNSTSDADFPTVIASAFEVDLYLRQLAVEALTGHWDGYSYNQNNFYLYHNGQTGKVMFIPYDVDNTWGIDWVGQDWGTYDLNAWVYPGQPRPLTNRILAVPAYRELYKNYVKELTETTFNHGYIEPLLTSFQSMLQFPVSQDTYFVRAFGFTYSDFLNSFSTRMNNHVEYGLKEYLHTRTRYAAEQLPGLITSVDESSAMTRLYPNPSVTPQVYYYSFTAPGSPVIVYTSAGTPVEVEVRTVDEKTTSITLPAGAPHGMYILRAEGKVIKWMYQ